MKPEYFDAALCDRHRRRAERIGQAAIGDTWLREHLVHGAGRPTEGDLGRGVPEMSLWYEDQMAQGGWFSDATAALAVLAAFPLVERRSGWTFGTYIFRDNSGGYGQTFARTLGTPLLSREELQTVADAGHIPGGGEPQLESALRWDPLDAAAWLWASLARRELEQLGGLWHGLSWSTESLLSGVDVPSIAVPEDTDTDAGTSLNPASFDFVQPPPDRWDPCVLIDEEGSVVVEFFTYGALHGERLWRHSDVYADGSTVPRTSVVAIAAGGPGFVF